MRKSHIKKLDFKERTWLFRSVISMILADKSIAKEEIEDLKDTLKMIAGKELKELGDYVQSPNYQVPLRPLPFIDYDHAFIILMEIARVAAIDSVIVLEEEELLKEVISLLDFDKKAINKVMKWTKRLALINSEEKKLKEELKQFYTERKK